MDKEERAKIYREHFTKEGYADVEQWVKNELEADEDIKAGRVTSIAPNEVRQFLDSLKKGEDDDEGEE
jgi:hypothetical protein